MSYSDVQNRVLAKIAYYDLSDRYEDFNAGKEYGVKVPLSNLLSSEEKENLFNLGMTEEEFSEWKLVDVHDTNDDNGFYACVIETGDGEAAVVFRGSESDNIKQLYHDWVKADFSLLNATMTAQQAEVENMMDREKFQTLMGNYKSVTPVGHSLGGNLAEYYTIMSDEHGLYENIDQCVSLDGPGFSKEFIKAHKGQIAKIDEDKKITHYRWSVVGLLLNELPIESNRYKTVESSGGLFERHSLNKSKIEGSNFVPKDELDEDAVKIGDASRWIDKNIGSGVSSGVIAVAASCLYAYSALKERIDETIAPYKEIQAQMSVVREAVENPEFYVDTAAFERLADESKQAAAELGEIAKNLVRARPNAPVPIPKQLDAIYKEIDSLIKVGSSCAKMAEESKSTLDAVSAYFRESAADIERAENDAISLMEAWNHA